MNDLEALAENAGLTSLERTRDVLSAATLVPHVEHRLLTVLDDFQRGTECQPVTRIRDLLDELRQEPEGETRLRQTNTVVRTIGQPENLALVLDALRQALEGSCQSEAAIAQASVANRRHASYGWNGATTIVNTLRNKTAGTSTPKISDLDKRFAGYPIPWWMFSIHVWQPNEVARAFGSSKPHERDLAMEPPHSHPFNFISMVVTGRINQSLYEPTARAAETTGRYAGVRLERVDHVWPPHTERQSTYLTTVEHRVPLERGNSYFMPSARIHDVDVERSTAATHPTITLFLATEAVEMPYSFIAPSMADFHDANPDLDDRSEPLHADRWSQKLEAISRYLRDESRGVNLGPIVDHQDSYAFFHA